MALPLKSPLLKVTSLPLALLKFCWIEAMYELKSVSDQLPIRQSPGRLGAAVVAAGSALSVSAAEEGSEVLLPEEAPLQAASMVGKVGAGRQAPTLQEVEEMLKNSL